MWAGNLVRARLLARKGIVDPTDFTSLLAWRLESNVSDVPDVPDVPAELLSWEGVAYHTANGTYKDVYSVGDMIPLDLGSEGIINMQIAAFDADPLADGSGTAAISWVGKELLATKHRMNPEYVSGTEGTGAIGGWEKCEMRDYLQSTIKSLIPQEVRNMIRAVTKTHNALDVSDSLITQTTSDDVWIPSSVEVRTGLYVQLFSDKVSRVKHLNGTATYWWERDAVSSKYKESFMGQTSSGGNFAASASGHAGLSHYNQGVCLGFCTGRTPT
jgi:hypothetical protein